MRKNLHSEATLFGLTSKGSSMSLRLDCQAVTAHWLTLSGPSELIIFSTSLILSNFSTFFSIRQKHVPFPFKLAQEMRKKY